MIRQDIYLVITPFFPSNESFVGSYVYDQITEIKNQSNFSIEIVKVVLLLTGALFGTRNQVHDYLIRFREYDWLWKDDMELAYRKFMLKKPAIEDFESELKRFMGVEADIEAVAPMHVIGALSLNTKNTCLYERCYIHIVTTSILQGFRA